MRVGECACSGCAVCVVRLGLPCCGLVRSCWLLAHGRTFSVAMHRDVNRELRTWSAMRLFTAARPCKQKANIPRKRKRIRHEQMLRQDASLQASAVNQTLFCLSSSVKIKFQMHFLSSSYLEIGSQASRRHLRRCNDL